MKYLNHYVRLSYTDVVVWIFLFSLYEKYNLFSMLEKAMERWEEFLYTSANQSGNERLIFLVKYLKQVVGTI